jgi:Fur family ferric uptake transcriptional regulator
MRPPSRTRNTKQRRIVLEELRKVTCHPSADELYNVVRRRLPRISLGTVYRNLELLARDGLIRKLEISGTQRRFDGDACDHYHMRCLRCGKVADLRVKRLVGVEDVARGMTDFEVMSHRIEFVGLCPQCKREKIAPRTKSEAPAGGDKRYSRKLYKTHQ